ncbi:hypothetical protein [Nocardioides terrisoli]|uniref:hypothetical protein n=1 Tax=Nocardioides terrisoli TaxID=3388267 RepID=UPI00287BB1E3|nr:hypothetical protein [Nocardioides marmorisolisilvae]
MSNNTSIWTIDRGYAMPSAAAACVVPSHAGAALRRTRGAVDLTAGFVTEPKFDAGPRTWSPPI